MGCYLFDWGVYLFKLVLWLVVCLVVLGLFVWVWWLLLLEGLLSFGGVLFYLVFRLF